MNGRPCRKLSWMKFWIDDILDGTTNDELLPDERAIWFELLLLAGRANDGGKIKTPTSSLPRVLNADKELIDRAIRKLTSKEINKLTVDDKGTLSIVNYEKYQPSRLETFRDKQPYKDNIHDSNILSIKEDIREDKDKDKNRIEDETKETKRNEMKRNSNLLLNPPRSLKTALNIHKMALGRIPI